MFYSVLLFGFLSIVSAQLEEGWALVGNPLAHFGPCKGKDYVLGSFESGRPPGEENQYTINIAKAVPNSSKVEVKFDSESTVNLSNSTAHEARISVRDDETFDLRFFKSSSNINFNVKGPQTGRIPYITSLKINTVEICDQPNPGVLDSYIIGVQDTAATQLKTPEGCGRRKVDHTELITNGLATKPGDWPWHAALYTLKRATLKYICGGTLLSKSIVVTAAHCVTDRGAAVVPDLISVVFGKYNLAGGDTTTQEKQIHKITIHERFNHTNLDSDIAVLKLQSEVALTDYIQPACLWYPDAYTRLPKGQIRGTVVGWGFDETDSLTTQLRQATIPKVSNIDCIESNPLFFSRMLNKYKFCAGFRNGTSACNGDSGGGFMIFVPDTAGDGSSSALGAWYLRGVVSVAVSRRDVNVCDSTQYVLFTDVAKFRGWVQSHL